MEQFWLTNKRKHRHSESLWINSLESSEKIKKSSRHVAKFSGSIAYVSRVSSNRYSLLLTDNLEPRDSVCWFIEGERDRCRYAQRRHVLFALCCCTGALTDFQETRFRNLQVYICFSFLGHFMTLLLLFLFLASATWIINFAEWLVTPLNVFFVFFLSKSQIFPIVIFFLIEKVRSTHTK